MTQAIYRIPQYPRASKNDWTRAICLGVQKHGEDLQATLEAVLRFERGLTHSDEEPRDPQEYISIAAQDFKVALAREFGQ